MKVIVINTGSSSIKYGIYLMPEEKLMANGSVEKLGEEGSTVVHVVNEDKETSVQPVNDHQEGLKLISQFVREKVLKDGTVEAVGHRVVHGGETYSQPTEITDEVLAKIDELAVLAPLHNPPNATGIREARKVFPHAAQVAVFDTAFHQSLPNYAYRYALPMALYQNHGVRVYGMHGTSHQYVAQKTAHYLKQPLQSLNLITIHLGNGCSMSAIRNGKSVDTSMGLSPLAGLMMGTRCGDIDPAIPYFLGSQLNMTFEEIDTMLNKESGLKGVAGNNDLREVLQRKDQGSPEAELALQMYTYRIKKYIGAYLAVLGHLDGIIFTAGVGENSSYIREKSLEGLANLGISLDLIKNERSDAGVRELQKSESKTKILVVPTDEELSIAQQTYSLLSKNNS
jgi:acetate kinase